MEHSYTIAESYTLPSKGLIYDKKVNPNVKIRSMTTEEEMRRLGHTDFPYKMLSEIIDDCLVENPGISVYDMHIGDYQFLLHKLRVVTYGSDYPITTVCPYCGKVNKSNINLDSIETLEYTDDLKKYFKFELPVCKKTVELRMQTPRMLDEIESKKKEFIAKHPDYKGDPAFLFSLQSMIKTVDGEEMDFVMKDTFIRKMLMRDVNKIITSANRVNASIGIDPIIENTCGGCGANYTTMFLVNSEFFGPSYSD